MSTDLFEEEQDWDVVDRSQLKTETEILHLIHRSNNQTFAEYQRRNLLYLEPRWLYRGRQMLKIAQILVIRQRENGMDTKGLYIYIQHWKKAGRTFPALYEKVKDIRLAADVIPELLKYVLQANATPLLEEEGSRPSMPAAEIFENLNAQQRQTFAHVLTDVALTHQLSELYHQGQLTLDVLDHLSAAAHHIRYKASLQELREMVEGVRTTWWQDGKERTVNEHAYQHWFEMHTWVFGTEYIRRINIREIEPAAKIDFALETVDGFLDILELKQPKVEVLQYDKSHDTWYLSSEVAKVLAQAAKYLDAIDRKTEDIYFRTRHDEKPLHFIRPRVRVVIGRSVNWLPEQHEAFRHAGATFHCIELMTFDHVISRAEQLVMRYEKSTALDRMSLEQTMAMVLESVPEPCE